MHHLNFLTPQNEMSPPSHSHPQHTHSPSCSHPQDIHPLTLLFSRPTTCLRRCIRSAWWRPMRPQSGRRIWQCTPTRSRRGHALQQGDRVHAPPCTLVPNEIPFVTLRARNLTARQVEFDALVSLHHPTLTLRQQTAGRSGWWGAHCRNRRESSAGQRRQRRPRQAASAARA